MIFVFPIDQVDIADMKSKGGPFVESGAVRVTCGEFTLVVENYSVVATSPRLASNLEMLTWGTGPLLIAISFMFRDEIIEAASIEFLAPRLVEYHSANWNFPDLNHRHVVEEVPASLPH
jgi:hypothetical protein